jgi:hypothetical protein
MFMHVGHITTIMPRVSGELAYLWPDSSFCVMITLRSDVIATPKVYISSAGSVYTTLPLFLAASKETLPRERDGDAKSRNLLPILLTGQHRRSSS